MHHGINMRERAQSSAGCAPPEAYVVLVSTLCRDPQLRTDLQILSFIGRQLGNFRENIWRNLLRRPATKISRGARAKQLDADPVFHSQKSWGIGLKF